MMNIKQTPLQCYSSYVKVLIGSNYFPLPARYLPFLVFIALLVIVPATCFATDSCISTDCHSNMGKSQFVHDPVANGECDACHAETGKKHPGKDVAFELVEQGKEICLQCHDNPMEDKELSHPPSDEDCTNCHSPHQGNRDKFLHEPSGELCLMCHDQIAQIIEDSQSQHAPVAEGECLNCHVPHASDFPPMLTVYYPRNTYTKFKKENFALCFECHESEAFTLEETQEATNFRNGDRNLHFVHVNRSKGRVCVNCHGIHGGDQLKLIHSESPAFGVWNIPITIEMTKTGATCFVGCHKEKSYDRINKVTNP